MDWFEGPFLLEEESVNVLLNIPFRPYSLHYFITTINVYMIV
jgi:hypothetical protein